MPKTARVARRPAVNLHLDEKTLDGLFAEFDERPLPGAAIGISVHGKPVYRRGFGLANTDRSERLTPATRMRIGSATKHFACLACLLLCEDGRASIDDPIAKHLPELHPASRDVTLRQLMGNISGLRDAMDVNWQFSGATQRVTSEEILALYRTIDDVNAPPATTWIYNNGGFLLLSTAIERIAGKSLEEVLRERLFAPIGMPDTHLCRYNPPDSPGNAGLYMPNERGGYTPPNFGTALAGEGGLVSTVDDMLRWLANFDKPVVGTAATWNLMRSPQTLRNGSSTCYSLGLMTGHYRGIEWLYHPGGLMGGSAQVLKVPSLGLDMAIMANRHDLSAIVLANKVLDTCLGGLDPAVEAPEAPTVQGLFRSPTTGRFVQFSPSADLQYNEWSRQQIASIDGFDLPVESDTHGTLRPMRGLDYQKLTLTLTGNRHRPSALRLNNFGNVDDLAPQKPPEHSDVRVIAGTYRSRQTDTAVTIQESDTGPELVSKGRFGTVTYALTCLTNAVWRARPKHQHAMTWGGTLSFRNGATAFDFSSWQTWSLPFVKD